MQLTETWDDATPHLITDVLTTPAPTSDVDVLPTIPQHVAERQRIPGEHMGDSGDPTVDHL